MVALIAAVTVGGKALGKSFAITKSTTILLVTGKILYSLEQIRMKFRSLFVKDKKR